MLRKWDSKARTYDKVISNSRYTQQQAKKIYNIDATIQYPQIHKKILKTDSNAEHQSYFIYTGRLVTFVKEVDKIIQACNQTQTPLIIMGDGPDKEKLQYMAGETIIFLPRIYDINQRIQLIQ
jgi:glycosyltransferase involved in cell wall biosynthesis